MKVKRFLSVLLAAAMTATCVPVTVFADTTPEYLPEGEIDSAYVDDGMFYLASSGAEIEENADHGYLLKVARTGEGSQEQSVRLTMTDITASYGKDYKIKLYDKSLLEGKIENKNESKSMLEVVENNSAEAYNYSDAIIDGTITAENQLTDEEMASELSEEKKQEIQEGTNEFLNSIMSDDEEQASDDLSAEEDTSENEPVTEGKFTLSQARENATGLKNDKQPLSYNSDNNETSVGYMSRGMEVVNEELSSAYMVINFEAGETEKFIEIIPIDNNESDGTRQAGFDIAAESEDTAVSGMYGNFTLKLIDDEEYVPAELSFTETEYYPENGYITVTVQRTGCMTSNLYAKVDTEDDTAVGSRDYSQVHASVLFAFGVKEQKIKIPVRSENLKEDSRFKIKLQEPVECTIGANSEAYGIIRPSDESFAVQLNDTEDDTAQLSESINLKSVETGDALKLKDISRDTFLTDNSGHNQAVSDTSWEMYIKSFFDSGKASVHFRVGKHYDYSGYEIQWERKSGTNNYGHTFFGHHDNVNTWTSQMFINTKEERWNSKKNQYFINTPATENLFLELYKRGWSSDPTLKIEYIKPILRPFEVELYGSDGIPVIDENGNTVIVKDDKISMSHASDNKLVTNTSSSITLSLHDNTNPKCYISGVKIVNTSTKEEAVIQDNLPVGTTSTAIDLTNDLIKDNLKYIEFKDNGSNGLYGSFAVKAILSNMPAQVKVKNDDRVDITLWDGNGGIKTGTNVGEYTVYNYNIKDSIRYSVNVKDDASYYTWNTLKIDTVRPSGIKPHGIYREALTDYAQERVTSSEIKVTPELTVKNNILVVRIKKSDIGMFKKRQGVLAYRRIENGDYYDYVIDGNSAMIPGKEYELTAVTSDESYLPLWSTASNRNLTYSQNTFYYTGSTQKDDNVIYLEAKKADDIPYSISGQMYYDDAALGSTVSAAAWYPAYGVYYMVDRTHYGITDTDGKVKTYPVKASEGSYIKYKVISSGATTYKTVKAERTNLQSETFETADGKTYTSNYYLIDTDNQTVSALNMNRPHITGVTVKNMEDLTTGEISINDKISYLTAYVETLDPNTGSEYQYSYQDGKETVTRTEKPKAVEFVVYDQVTHKEKAVIDGAVSKDGGKTWTVAKTFEKGKYSEYRAGDILYARLTTDRYIGNGKSEDLNGNVVEVDALKETRYAPVRTTLTFSEINPVQSQSIDIKFGKAGTYELPLIGELSSILDILGFDFGIEKTDTGGVRLFYGKQIKSLAKGNKFDGNGKSVSDTGFKIDEDNFQEGFSEMADMINTMGSENALGAMSIGIPVWSIKPYAGIYLEFTLYHDPLMDVAVRLEFSGGGGYIGAKGSFRYTYYMVVYGVPVYVGGAVSLDLMGEFGMSPDQNVHIAFNDPSQSLIDEIIDNTHFQFVFQASLKAEAYAGVGIYGTLGLRGGFVLSVKYIYNPTIKKSYPSVRENGFSVSGSIKFWVDAVNWTIPIPVYSWKYLALGYFEDIKKVGNILSLSESNGAEIVSKPRNAEESKFVANDSASLQSTFEGISTRNIIENSYDDAQHKLISMGDGKILMVYLDDDKSRDESNRTVLKYSIYSGGNWSEPITVQDDQTADFSPAVCDAGNDIVLTWVSRPEGTQLDGYKDHLSKTEIYTVRINKSTGEMGVTERLTNDDYYDTNPIPVYDDETGDVLVLYSKSYVGDINNGDELLNATLPEVNNAEIAYMLYDGASNTWVRDKFFDNELAEGADADKLIADFGGQRFLATQIEEFGMNNPVISDFKAESGLIFDSTYDELIRYIEDKGYDLSGDISDEQAVNIIVAALEYYAEHLKSCAVFAYTVDEDRNLATDSDREVFVQLYDYKEHKAGKPIRVTNNNTNDSLPQLVDAGGEVYLFWLNDGNDVEYANLYQSLSNDGEVVTTHKVDVFSTDGEEDLSIGNFKAFADENQNIFIAWQQSSDNGSDETKIKQDIYIAGYVAELDENGEDIGTWSDAVRMTDNGKLNELPEFAAVGNDKLMMVNTQYDFDISGDVYHTSNVNLVETEYGLKSSIGLKALEPQSVPQNAGDAFDVNIVLRNNGVKSEPGFSYNAALMCGNEVCEEFSGRVDEPVTAGNEYMFAKTLHMPAAAVDQPEKLSLRISVQEDNTGDYVVGELPIFDGKPEYSITGLNASQRGDYFEITGTVTNIGSADSAEGDKLVITENGNYDNVLAAKNIEGLEAGKSEAFAVSIKATNELTKSGYLDCMLVAASEDNTPLSEMEAVRGYVINAFDLGINGDTEAEEITVKAGETLKLESSYAPDEYYRNAQAKYAVYDTTIAKVEDGVLYGLEAGETDMYMTMDPYGGSRSIRIKVEGTAPVPTAEPTTGPTTEPTVEPVVTAKPSGGSGGGGTSHSVNIIAPPMETPVPTAPVFGKFSDVSSEDWFSTAVNYMSDKGIVNGVSDTAFEPQTQVTRAMFATMLHRYAGTPDTDAEITFNDVEEGAYYSMAVRWAVSQGIITGYDEGTFAPNDALTREQAAAMLYRYAQSIGADTSVGENTNILSYDDYDSISEYAIPALCWTAGSGVMTGRTQSTINPIDNLTRAETAQMLYNYMQYYQ